MAFVDMGMDGMARKTGGNGKGKGTDLTASRSLDTSECVAENLAITLFTYYLNLVCYLLVCAITGAGYLSVLGDLGFTTSQHSRFELLRVQICTSC